MIAEVVVAETAEVVAVVEEDNNKMYDLGCMMYDLIRDKV
jgi:hypothetical protein